MKTRFKHVMSYIPLISNKTKIIISISLVIFAALVSYANNYTIDSQICLLAMLFSFLGDISLNCMPLDKRPRWFLYLGAVFFMISHIIYATAYYWLINTSQKLYFNPGAIIATFFILLLFTTSVFLTIYSKNKLQLMTIIIFCLYTSIIGINFITIYSYSWSFGTASFIGALSFLISDFIIGIETVFKVKSDTLRKFVWIFYPIGQVMIIACR